MRLMMPCSRVNLRHRLAARPAAGRHPVRLLRGSREIVSGVRRSAITRVTGSRWICSNIKASSCSHATMLPVPDGQPARTVEDAIAAAEAIGYPVCHQGPGPDRGAGQARGDQDRQRTVPRPEEHSPTRSSGMDIRGLTVHELWIEGASEIASEYYASVVFDRSAKAPLVMLSTKGGMDIEAGGR